MKKYWNYILLFIFLIIIIGVFLFYNKTIFENFSNNDDYVVICANYNKPTDFLEEIPIKSIVLKKGEEIPNKAHEATTYLHYMIKNYDNLPENMIFIHDENESWHHDGKITERIYEWIEKYEKNGKTYYEINDKEQNVKEWNNKTHEKFWNEVFLDYFGEYDKCKKVDGKCCAQFIISKNNILQHPKSLYEKYYNWLVTNTHGEGNGDEKDEYSGFYTSRYAEWTWNTLLS